MKGIFIHISALVLVVYFLFAGIGFNIINYCCETCSNHGIYEVAKYSCGQFHHTEDNCCSTGSHEQTQHQDSDAACSNISHIPESCHLLRINVETPTIVADDILKVEISTIDLFLPVFVSVLNFEFNTKSNKNHSSPPPITPPQAGRTILSEKSVLII